MSLWIELVIVFFLIPLLVYCRIIPIRWSIPLLVLGSAGAGAIALSARVTPAQVGIGAATAEQTARCLAVGLGVWLVAQLAFSAPRLRSGEPVFPFVAKHPRIFAALVIAYAVSVVAQEYLFRGYFFWRYAGLGSPAALFALNVLAFGWVHIIFRSWVSVVATVLGGVIFTGLFLAYHSFVGICVVHMAFGLSIFAMGYGRYFLTESVEPARREARLATARA
jgi:uncharacterized protein